ncbi:thiol-disulfide oxidoreductase ResA [mine drainage metagenome]|uniref:Thiol-disulfide oxidoreductase ResA n=1 Tax=mine drainage metagenome TaxID=410659 RepID=A0A1J5TDT8_9ZZZZ
MKKIIFFLFFLMTTNFIFSQQIKKVKIDDVLKMIDTTASPLVINFWASWCKPCVHEIPWFEKTMEPFKTKGVKLILVSVDYKEDYPKRLTKFVNEQNYRSTIFWLDETDANMFCPKIDRSWDGTIPVTLMVNNKKHYRQFYNQQLPEPRLKLELQKLIE